MQVGRDVTPAQLMDDWVLVHEMTHLALPDMGETQSWFSEGLAVYVEGIARVQAGNRYAAGCVYRADAADAARDAAARRPGTGSHAHLGAHLLGRRHVLFPCGC